jgi:signal peptidase II
LEACLKRPAHIDLLLGGIAGTVVAIDQISKALVRTYLPVDTAWSPWTWLLPYARFFHTENTGVAFGMFQGANVLFAVLAVLISIAIIYYYPSVPKKERLMRVALGLQLGGALGNLVDRVVFGYVTDFISVGRFAVFNVADSSITIGVIILLIAVWIQEQKKKDIEDSQENEFPGSSGQTGSATHDQVGAGGGKSE